MKIITPETNRQTTAHPMDVEWVLSSGYISKFVAQFAPLARCLQHHLREQHVECSVRFKFECGGYSRGVDADAEGFLVATMAGRIPWECRCTIIGLDGHLCTFENADGVYVEHALLEDCIDDLLRDLLHDMKRHFDSPALSTVRRFRF
jgi:hypothetical protein